MCNNNQKGKQKKKYKVIHSTCKLNSWKQQIFSRVMVIINILCHLSGPDHYSLAL